MRTINGEAAARTSFQGRAEAPGKRRGERVASLPKAASRSAQGGRPARNERNGRGRRSGATARKADGAARPANRTAKAGKATPARGGSKAKAASRKEVFPGFDAETLASLLAPACFYAWVYLMSFSSVLYENIVPVTGEEGALFSTQQMLALVGILAAIAYRLARNVEPAPASSTKVLAWSIVATAGTLAQVLAHLAPVEATVGPLLAVAAFAAGLCMGLIQVQWIVQYARHGARRATWEWPFVLVAAGVLSAVPLAAPFLVGLVYVCLLPFAGGLCIERFTHVRPVEGDADRVDACPKDKSPEALPGALVFGIVVMGLVYGVTQHFALAYDHENSAVAVDCLVSSVILGALLLTYAKRTGRNFAQSTLALAIVPVAGFGQCMVAMYQADHILVSFFFVRIAYLAFDTVLWMQLPRVYERLGSVRLFLVARLLFEGSLTVGFAVQMVLARTGFLYFDFVALGFIALLLTALTVAFANGSAGTMWDLMPEPTRYVGKFRRACKQIETEYGLTNRESEVVELVMRGRSGPFIQDKLVISKNTYQTHMRNIYLKLGVHSQQELLNLLEDTMDEQRKRAA